MRKIFLLNLLIALSALQAEAQYQKTFVCGYTTSVKPVFCDFIFQKSYIQNQGTLAIIKSIMDKVALPQNFVLVECSNIGNAFSYCSSTGTRYIVIDSEWLSAIASKNWFNVSILAHEIGQHLCGHTTNIRSLTLSEARKQELEADRFSGFILQGLGATYNQSITAINTLVPVELDDAASDHPSRSKRLAAIKQGYYKTTPVNTNNGQVEYAEAYWNIGSNTLKIGYEHALKGAETQEDRDNIFYSLKNYEKAIKLNPSFIDAYWSAGECYLVLSAKKMLSTSDACSKAINYFKKIIDLVPNDMSGQAKAYDGIGEALENMAIIDNDPYSRMNKINDAISYLDKSILLDPYGNPDVYFDRGGAYLDLWFYNKLPTHDKACSDIYKACKMGQPEACQIYKNYCK